MLRFPLYKVLLIVISAMFILFYMSQLDEQVRGADAGEKLSLVYNLAQHGEFAFNDKYNSYALYPSNFREPLPIVLSAFSYSLFNSETNLSYESFKKSKLVQYIKYPSLFFLLLLIGCIYWLTIQVPTGLGASITKVVLFTSVMLSLHYLHVFSQVNTFDANIHSASLLLLIGCLLASYFQYKKIYKLILVGLIYGMLCLSKAAFLYSGLGLLALFFLYQLANNISIKQTMIVFIMAVLTISPWLVRNKLETGQLAISGRGPETFADRTYEEIWNDEHAWGLLYAYGPDFLKPTVTRLTGYSFKDRLKGGRLQHSTRQHLVDMEARKLGDESLAINSHFKAGIWMTHIYDALYEKYNNPVLAKMYAAQAYQDFNFKEMFTHPLRHLKFTAIFMWRGIWPLNAIDGRSYYEMGIGKKPSVLREVLPFIGFSAVVSIFFHSLRHKRHLPLILTALPLSLFFFQSFFSHNLPRYSIQLIPAYMLGLAYLLLLIKKASKRIMLQRFAYRV